MNRRSFLFSSIATLVSGITLSRGAHSAISGPKTSGKCKPCRIDTHHHIVPPEYSAWLTSKGITAGGLPIPAWDASEALRVMDSMGVTTSICSVSTPGVHLGDDAEARSMARTVNEYAAEVANANAGRFGYFATLTLPDVDGAIAEASYALDNLNADGVVLLANINGRYLGDPGFEPLMQELDSRKSVVFIHPTTLSGGSAPGLPAYVADFLLDTTRAAIGICRAGWLEKYPGIRFILSHAGGFIPYASMRIAPACSEDGTYDGGIARLQKFYYDTALSASPYALPSLLAFADPTHITFGSDWPYAPESRSAHFAKLLDGYDLEVDQRLAINRGNAQALFPRFKNITSS